MLKSIRLAAVAASVVLGSLAGTAAPSPFMGMPMSDWDLGHEPSLKGGAKSIEQVSVREGKPSKSKYVITLDDKGEYLRNELVTEGSDKTYVSEFKRNADGSLSEITQTIKTAGQPDLVNSRQKATYANGKLVSIVGERCLTKKELQPEGTTSVETAADGSTTLDMKNAKGESQMKITMTYGKDGRMEKGTMAYGTRSSSTTVTRNADGWIESATVDGQGTVSIQYEKDDKGNWTKATQTMAMKGPDGQERKMVSEIVRKITY